VRWLRSKTVSIQRLLFEMHQSFVAQYCGVALIFAELGAPIRVGRPSTRPRVSAAPSGTITAVADRAKRFETRRDGCALSADAHQTAGATLAITFAS
jgi:hypothetical protein